MGIQPALLKVTQGDPDDPHHNKGKVLLTTNNPY